MFETAYSVASDFTHPVIISRRVGNGAVDTALGAYIVLNEEWAITAAHIVSMYQGLADGKARFQEYELKLAEVEQDSGLDKAKRKREIKKLKSEYNPDRLPTKFSIWLGADTIQITKAHLDVSADLAAFQYEAAPEGWGTPYPYLREGPWRPGVAVMKYGYPFHEVGADYDSESDRFQLKNLPVPVFPMEGITTRIAQGPPGPSYPRNLLETSSPGLRGQSGGPIVDTEGTVWAVQSNTRHYPLGFNPSVQKGNTSVEEHQFLNVGMGPDATTIKGFLDSHGINYQTR